MLKSELIEQLRIANEAGENQMRDLREMDRKLEGLCLLRHLYSLAQ